MRHSVAVPAAVVPLAVAAVAALQGGGVTDQLTRQQRQHGLVRITGDAAVQPHTGPDYGALGTAADVAADDGIYAAALQEADHDAVAAALSGSDLGVQNHTAFHRVELELRRVAKVRKHCAVFIGDCNFHADFLSFRYKPVKKPSCAVRQRQPNIFIIARIA